MVRRGDSLSDSIELTGFAYDEKQDGREQGNTASATATDRNTSAVSRSSRDQGQHHSSSNNNSNNQQKSKAGARVDKSVQDAINSAVRKAFAENQNSRRIFDSSGSQDKTKAVMNQLTTRLNSLDCHDKTWCDAKTKKCFCSDVSPHHCADNLWCSESTDVTRCVCAEGLLPTHHSQHKQRKAFSGLSCGGIEQLYCTQSRCYCSRITPEKCTGRFWCSPATNKCDCSSAPVYPNEAAPPQPPPPSAVPPNIPNNNNHTRCQSEYWCPSSKCYCTNKKPKLCGGSFWCNFKTNQCACIEPQKRNQTAAFGVNAGLPGGAGGFGAVGGAVGGAGGNRGTGSDYKFGPYDAARAAFDTSHPFNRAMQNENNPQSQENAKDDDPLQGRIPINENFPHPRLPLQQQEQQQPNSFQSFLNVSDSQQQQDQVFSAGEAQASAELTAAASSSVQASSSWSHPSQRHHTGKVQQASMSSSDAALNSLLATQQPPFHQQSTNIKPNHTFSYGNPNQRADQWLAEYDQYNAGLRNPRKEYVEAQIVKNFDHEKRLRYGNRAIHDLIQKYQNNERLGGGLNKSRVCGNDCQHAAVAVASAEDFSSGQTGIGKMGSNDRIITPRDNGAAYHAGSFESSTAQTYSPQGFAHHQGK